MTPKEKAKELFDKMYWHFRTVTDTDICKQCALIAVDELIDNCENIFDVEYWQEVKFEMKKL